MIVRPWMGLLPALMLLAGSRVSAAQAQAPRLLWNLTAERRIPLIHIMPNGGAVLGMMQDTQSGDASMRDVIRRVNPDGSTAWERNAPQGMRLVLRDAASDGSVVLLSLVPEPQNGWMDLLLVDADGKTLAERKKVSATPMVFVDPKTRDILRWDNEVNDLFFETFAGDKVHWRWHTLFPKATTPGALYPRFSADYVALIPLNQPTIHAINRAGKILWAISDLAATHSGTAAVSESGRSVLALSPASLPNLHTPKITWEPNPMASARGELAVTQFTVSLLYVARPPIPKGFPLDTNLMWQETTLRKQETELVTTDGFPRPGFSGLGYQTDVRSLDVLELPSEDGVDVSILVHRAGGITVTTLQNWRITKSIRTYNLDALRDLTNAWLTADDRLLVARPGHANEYRLVKPSGEVVWSYTFPEGEGGPPIFSPDRRYVAFAGQNSVSVYAL